MKSRVPGTRSRRLPVQRLDAAGAVAAMRRRCPAFPSPQRFSAVDETTQSRGDSAVRYLFEGLTRRAPGSEASTREAIRRLPPLPAAPRILDLGSGAGAQTLMLARVLGGRVTAVDLDVTCLRRLRADAAKADLAERITALAASMDGLGFPSESFDLIWSEGAAYNIGVARALALWRPLLRSAGALVFSELCWLTDRPPERAAAFWRKNYPAMADRRSNLEIAYRCGYEVIDSFPLPSRDWTESYYRPLEARIGELSGLAEQQPELNTAIRAIREEIELYRRHGGKYGYVFFIFRKPLARTEKLR